MQVIRSLEREDATLVGWGVRVLLLSIEGQAGLTGRRLASIGGRVEAVSELYEALSALIDDPSGYALFVVDCDGVGGIDAVRAGLQKLGGDVGRVPVILVSRDCREQRFPDDRTCPTILRAPLSSVALRVGFEHALRDRFFYRVTESA